MIMSFQTAASTSALPCCSTSPPPDSLEITTKPQPFPSSSSSSSSSPLPLATAYSRTTTTSPSTSLKPLIVSTVTPTSAIAASSNATTKTKTTAEPSSFSSFPDHVRQLLEQANGNVILRMDNAKIRHQLLRLCGKTNVSNSSREWSEKEGEKEKSGAAFGGRSPRRRRSRRRRKRRSKSSSALLLSSSSSPLMDRKPFLPTRRESTDTDTADENAVRAPSVSTLSAAAAFPAAFASPTRFPTATASRQFQGHNFSRPRHRRSCTTPCFSRWEAEPMVAKTNKTDQDEEDEEESPLDQARVAAFSPTIPNRLPLSPSSFSSPPSYSLPRRINTLLQSTPSTCPSSLSSRSPLQRRHHYRHRQVNAFPPPPPLSSLSSPPPSSLAITTTMTSTSPPSQPQRSTDSDEDDWYTEDEEEKISPAQKNDEEAGKVTGGVVGPSEQIRVGDMTTFKIRTRTRKHTGFAAATPPPLTLTSISSLPKRPPTPKPTLSSTIALIDHLIAKLEVLAYDNTSDDESMDNVITTAAASATSDDDNGFANSKNMP